MKTPYAQIYAVLKINRIIVLSCMISATLCVLFSGWMLYTSYQKFASSAFAISTSGEVIPLKLIADGVYNRLIQYSLVQRVLQVDSQLNLNASPIQFTTTLTFEINRGTVTDTYQLVTTGSLINVARNFPNNPHGLLITDYFEQRLQKIDSQE